MSNMLSAAAARVKYLVTTCEILAFSEVCEQLKKKEIHFFGADGNSFVIKCFFYIAKT